MIWNLELSNSRKDLRCNMNYTLKLNPDHSQIEFLLPFTKLPVQGITFPG